MQEQMQVFENTEFGKIRAIEIDGAPWFVGKDVTGTLGYTNASEALKYHVDEEDKLNSKTLLSLGQRGGWLINESGLYSLVLSSKLPNVKNFKRWVTSDILPTIRKHGAYITDEVLRQMRESKEYADELLNRLDHERREKESLNAYVQRIEPKAMYYDVVMECRDTFPVTQIAKEYGYKTSEFNLLLNAFKVQSKSNGKTWVLNGEYADKDYTFLKPICRNGCHVILVSYWTHKGHLWLYDFLKARGIVPLIERAAQK